MHIGFQRSGGRGEYEVVGSHSGYTAMTLEGWSFNIRWPDGVVRETDLWLDPADSGKPRLRSLRQQAFQIGRQVAAMLLLPDPRREFAETASGIPVARSKQYVLTRLGFGPDTEFTGIQDVVTIDPVFVDLDNQTDKETIGVKNRWSRVNTIYLSCDLLPDDLAAEVRDHREMMATGSPIDANLVGVVLRIQKKLAQHFPSWGQEQDPLPALERMLGIVPADVPDLPPPDEIGEEEPVVSARSAAEYRLAKMRGSAGRLFSLQVREQYHHRCAFCGAMLGGVPAVRSGVDAAHILAWSKFDLDIVPNGMALCKLHHWAFDAALMMPVYDGSAIQLQFTELAVENFDTFSLEKLGRHGSFVSEDWLPTDRKLWPEKKYLERLYADLAVEFSHEPSEMSSLAN